MDNAMNKLWQAQQDAAHVSPRAGATCPGRAADRAPRTPAPSEADDPT